MNIRFCLSYFVILSLLCYAIPATGVTVKEGHEFFSVPVGHGDAHILKSADGNYAVIDAGSTETVDRVISILDRRKVSKLHSLVLTHPHWDHIGGTLKLLSEFNVRRIIKPGLNHSSPLHRRINERLKNAKISPEYLRRGDTTNLLPGIPMRILNPVHRSPDGNLNNRSLAFQMTVDGVRFSMMGDVTGQAEKDVLKNTDLRQSDILKVAHHGDADGTTQELLDRLQPEIAIITAPMRKNDPWGYPDQKLFDRLRKRGITIHHTGRDGLFHLTLPQDGASPTYRRTFDKPRTRFESLDRTRF